MVNIPICINVNFTKTLFSTIFKLKGMILKSWLQTILWTKVPVHPRKTTEHTNAWKVPWMPIWQNCILRNAMEWQIAVIPITYILSNVIMIKYESAVNANIQSIKKNIRALEKKIKGMGIENFHEKINSLTTVLTSHSIIMPYLMYRVFKAYNVCKDS